MKEEARIIEKKENNERLVNDSFLNIINSISGKGYINSDLDKVKDALLEILKYYHCSLNISFPTHLTSFQNKLDYICDNNFLTYREIELTPNWYKDMEGAIIVFSLNDNIPITCIPSLFGYKYLLNGKYHYINKKNQGQFSSFALSFYRCYANSKLTLKDIILFSLQSVSLSSYLILGLTMLLTTFFGLLLPRLTYFLFGPFVEQKSNLVILFLTITFMLSVSLSLLLLTGVKSIYNQKIENIIELKVEAANIKRLFSLKPSFFKKFSPGEIDNRINLIKKIASSLISLIFNSILTLLFSLIYFISIVCYSPSLVIPAIIVLLVSFLFSIISTLIQINISEKRMISEAKEAGIANSLMSSISKIRVTGSEQRLFAKWANIFAESAKNKYDTPLIIKYNAVITLTISLIGNFVITYFAFSNRISVAEYCAFNSAYGLLYGTFASLTLITIKAAQIKPLYLVSKPFLDEIPEQKENKDYISSLKGNININNISFKYNEASSYIYKNFSLKINKGEYVAIIGKSGTGKSTLLRLLLGFEKPEQGAIYYDNSDINTINIKSLRRNIGTVMQDEKLLLGTIFSNIKVCAPTISEKEVYDIMDEIGFGDEIRKLPMGLNTLINGEGNGFSGGQKQMILITRALASKPNILFFDEATSSLDNISQKRISNSLAKIKCTRLIIAHRLSTIKECDRIIYIDDGKILEEGTYEQLIKKNGYFTKLFKRQMVNKLDN